MATHDVTTFVQSLKDFREHLPPAQRAMLDHIIHSAQHSDETAGYGCLPSRTESDLIDDTAGYMPRVRFAQEGDETVGYMPRMCLRVKGDEQAPLEAETREACQPGDDEEQMWTELTTWLSQEDETEEFTVRFKSETLASVG